MGGITVRIIDTPVVGDTNGILRDKGKNAEHSKPHRIIRRITRLIIIILIITIIIIII